MSGCCLHCNNRARHERNGREPLRAGGLTGLDNYYSICPVLIRPISKCAHAIVLSEGKLRIARLKAKLADLAKLDTNRGWCGGSNPFAFGAPPAQQERALFD